MFLNDSIDSVLNQTFEEFEFIIVNDGSSDRTEEVILSKKDKRIRYIKNERNQGVIKSLNKGVFFSKGMFIARMDSDDIASPYRFQKQVDYLLSNCNTDILGTGIMDSPSFDSNCVNSTIIPNEVHKVYLLRTNTLYHPTIMFRKVELQSKGLFYDKNCILAEDYKLWADASINGLTLESLTQPLLMYRKHNNQISIKGRELQTQTTFKIQLKLGFFYFEDMLYNRELPYLRLLNKSDLVNQHELLDRMSLCEDLIDFNNKNEIFNRKIFEEMFLSLIKI